MYISYETSLKAFQKRPELNVAYTGQEGNYAEFINKEKSLCVEWYGCYIAMRNYCLVLQSCHVKQGQKQNPTFSSTQI